MKKRLLIFVLAGMSMTPLCWASPTGLNNIPTADVVPEKVLVLQGVTDIGKSNKPDYFIGFKYGLIKNLEIGLDGRIFPEPALEETISGQVKYRLELGEYSAIAAGVSNIGDHATTGYENYYAAVTHDFGFLRAHVGGTLQKDNEGAFVGLDKTFQLFERDFTLRTDLIQTNERDDITGSVGFIYDLGHNVLLESWVSIPTQSGRYTASTVKLNYVIKF